MDVFATSSLEHFIKNRLTKEDFISDKNHLQHFIMLDDTDVLATVKMGVLNEDKVLSKLCDRFMNRRLYHVELSNNIPSAEKIAQLRTDAMKLFNVTEEEVHYFVFTQLVENSAYDLGEGNINILMKDGTIQDITTASDLSNLEVLAKKVQKFMIAYPKEIH